MQVYLLILLSGPEAHSINEKDFVQVAIKKLNVSHGDLYVASSDKKAIRNVKRLVAGRFNVQQLAANTLSNVLEKRNDKKKNTMENILLDLYVLSHCSLAIVTFSSNVGRLVWELKTAMFPYDAKDSVISMDSRLFYGWYDYDTATPYCLTIQENKSSYVVGKDYIVMKYGKGDLYFCHHRKIATKKDGTNVKLKFVTLRGSNPQVKGYIPAEHLLVWPGEPNYINDIQ